MHIIKREHLHFIIPILIWGAFCGIYTYLLNKKIIDQGFLIIIEMSLDLIIFYLAIRLFKKTNWNKFVGYFAFSLIFIFMTDTAFYIVFYYLGHIKPSNFYDNFYLIPFLGFLLFQIFFWLRISSKYLFHGRNQLGTFILFFLLNIIALGVFLLASAWEVKVGTYLGYYQVITGLIELVIFDLAILGLICCNTSGFYFLTSGLILIIASNFWEKYLFLNQTLAIYGDYSEYFWIFGLILIIEGLYLLMHNEDYLIQNWVRSFSSVKSRLAFWIFAISILSFLIFFIIGYHFKIINKDNFLSLPFFVMVYSVIIVIFSSYLGNKLVEPFNKLQKNIELFMSTKTNKEKLMTDFSIEEFSFLQNFILNAVESNEERDKAKKAMGDMALQVAHDIRSPLAAILMMAQECNELPEERRLSLRDAANRIQDIANNLLNRYLGDASENENVVKPILVSTAILSVLSEKRFQYKDKNIQFQQYFAHNSYFSFIKANLGEFKRVLSNLINNGVEAIANSGVITISLTTEGDHIKIIIHDNGKGMGSEKVQKILMGEHVETDKSMGMGLGLTHARKFLQKNHGNLVLQSKPGLGTDITLNFQNEKVPVWIADKISLDPNSLIVVLDDDTSIHGAWDQKFTNTLNAYPNITITHFHEADSCINFIKSLNKKDFKRVMLLTDYELIKQTINGLDVVEITAISRAILVTSHYENQDIIKRSILLNTKVLPKILTSAVSFDIVPFKETIENSDVSLLLLEDNKEFSEVLEYLYKSRGKNLKIFNDPYSLMEKLPLYKHDIKICLDFEIDSPINGVELSEIIYKRGYSNLYLATGYKMNQEDLPPYLKLLTNKMDLLNL